MSQSRNYLALCCSMLLIFSLPSTGHAENEAPVTNPDQEALIEKEVASIVELKPISKDFYIQAAKKVGKTGGTGCVLGGLAAALLSFPVSGPVGAGYAAAQGCAGGGIIFGLLQALDVPARHWSESTQAAYRARKAYVMSFQWLGIEPFDMVGVDEPKAKKIVQKAWHASALKYHPDKLPKGATENHRKNAEIKLANARFAKSYIIAFQKRYGVLDALDDGPAARRFLEQFAGHWAAAFGTTDGPGGTTQAEMDEWMYSIKNYVDLKRSDL